MDDQVSLEEQTVLTKKPKQHLIAEVPRRQAKECSALGANTVYWVWFDVPQLDPEGDGPYRSGQIHEDANGPSPSRCASVLRNALLFIRIA